MRAPEKKVQHPAAQGQWPVVAMLPDLACLCLSEFCLSLSLPLCFFLALFDSPPHLLCVSLPLLSSMSPPLSLVHKLLPISLRLRFLCYSPPWTPSGMPSDSAAHKINFVYDVPSARSQIWTRVPTGEGLTGVTGVGRKRRT